GDGRLDVVASNWGLNTGYRATAEAPLRLYFGDFDSNGTVDLIEAGTDPETGRIVPRRDLQQLATGLPGLRVRFPKHRLFATADIRDILQHQFSTAREVQATTLASVVLLNRGDRFEARPLPPEAQFAPAFGLNVADADGDGHEDLFLSQNFFAVRNEDSRCDAGRGLWLRGDGRGGFQAVPGQRSGVRVYGEQRGSATGDFDGDGRVDLAVTQYGGETRLFRNTAATPGLRVKLAGPPLNPAGVGAVMRLKFGEELGAARAIHGGSGYWSQDSPVAVLATPRAATAIWVRWPGGRVSTHELPAGARQITVRIPGA
ncbi:MAG TPA: VCBS repeat-containing protein, partial [Methylomirabilota bacterium]|nr:VCBS repeat-containing protein [Methylomirabilota bacterium]